ncbi:hypothetical protein B2J88_29335 [Rhodococcus sp. SRB_17]|nr:hypothetical protein [Rhodococcus sp. SRB_17]
MKNPLAAGSGGRRVGWSLSSQIASNGSNFLLTVLVARAVSAADLGLFAILMAVNGLVVGIVRGFTSEPMTFGEESVSHYEGVRRHNAVVGSSALLAGAVSLLLLPVIGLITGNWILAATFTVAGALVGAQDAIRFVLVSTQRSRNALVLECVWIAVQLPLIWLTYDRHSVAWLVLCWTIGALCSVVYGIWCLRLSFSWRDCVSWIRDSFRIGLVYAFDYLLGGGIAQLVTFLVAAIAGLGAAGEYRGAQMLLMPLSILTLGLTFALSPEVARMAGRSEFRRLRSVPAMYATLIAVSGLVCVGTLSLLPSSVMTGLLGDAAPGASALLPSVALATCLVSMGVGPGLVLRAIGKVKEAFVLKSVTAPMSIGAVIVGCIYFGVIGSQIGLAIVACGRAVGMWVLMNRRMQTKFDVLKGAL